MVLGSALMDRDMNSDVSPERLAELLGMTLNGVVGEGPEAAADGDSELLEAELVGVLSLDTTVLDSLPTVVGQLDRDVFAGGGGALGSALTDPETGLAVIRKIKLYAKKAGTDNDSGARYTVAVAVYYAAIAAALVFHKVKITKHSVQTLKAEFKVLSQKAWISKELAGLFSKAAEAMR